MKKILFIALVLSLMFGQVCFADTQIDSGTNRGQSGANNVWFVARNTGTAAISADRVVIWDTNSQDGISVKATTTSYDTLVAGVTMDAISAVSTDATAANSAGNSNWGRVQVYGLHKNVSFDPGGTVTAAGARIASHSTSGLATLYRAASRDPAATSQVSDDYFGISLEAVVLGTRDLDIFITRM